MATNQEKINRLFELEEGLNPKDIDFLESIADYVEHISEKQQEWLDDLYYRHC